MEFHAGERENRINDCTVLLSWGAEAEIPDDVQVEIREIELGSDEYEALYADALERLPEADADSTQVMRFFDITLYTENDDIKEKVEPKAAVSVEVRVDEVVESDVTAIHYGEEETTLVDATAEGQTVTFEADSFSIYGVAYSKDAEQRSMSTRVQVDLTAVDQMDAATVTGDTVTLSLSELLAGADADVTVRGELGVDGETFVADAEVTTASDVTVEDGAITLDAEALARGSVTLEMKTREVDEEHTTTVVTHTATIELADYPGRTDEVSGEGVTVAPVNSEETTLPGNTTASAEAVAVPEGIIDEAENAVVDAVTFDITLTDGKGEAIPEPGLMEVTVSPTNVNIYDKLPEGAVPGQVSYTLFHSHEGQEPVELPIDPEDVIVDAEGNITEFKFQTSSFSEFTLKYTVDFHWEVDGLEFVYSIEGGSAIALSELVKILGIVEEDSVPEFIASIEDVTFSTPELLWVGKAGEDTTVGAIKAANDLQIEYSDALSEEQIAAIDAMAIGAQDWALISLRAFDTQETLTVTMKNGEQFVIRTTDARRPKLSDSYGRIKIVKEWYDPNGARIEAPTLDNTYTSDFILTAYEYVPSDLVRLHFVGADGNDVNDPVIVPTGSLQLTLFNTPEGGGKGYVFGAKPTSLDNPSNDINMLTDVNIQPKSVTLDNNGATINTWVMNIDLNDYAGELYDVYLGIEPGSDTRLNYFTSTTAPMWGGNASASTHAMNIAFLDSGRWQGDTYRNRHIWDMIKGTNNEYTLQNQDLELTSAGGKFFGYTIVENEASANGAKNFTTTISWNNGANVIYTNGLTGWTPNLYLNTPVLSNTDATVVTVKNQMRADVDVPVEKSWPYLDGDTYDNQYDWEATFVLQYAPLYEGESTPSTPFTEVEPRQYITITEAMMDAGNSEEAIANRSFKKLPMYGEDENGPFRYEYSVEEESYTIYAHGNPSSVLATYDRYGEEGNKYTGDGLPHFVPFYPHDAGELSANASDYKVMVVNGEAYSTESPKINITVNKDWEDDALMLDPTAKAAVKVQRYVQEIHRTKTSDYDATQMVEVKFFDEDGSKVKSVYVPKGVKQRLHIIWNSYGYGTSAFAISSTSPEVSFIDNYHNVSELDSYTDDWFTPTDGMEFHITVNKWGGDWQGKMPGVSPVAGLQLEDEQSRTEPEPDAEFNDSQSTFDLKLSNNWSEMVSGLPLVGYGEDGDDLITYLYSYYFVEDPSGTVPAGYEPRYVRYDTVGTDHEVELGDNKYRINYDGEHVTVVNRKETLRVRKEWRGVARKDWALYPDAKFDLYGSRTAGGNGINPEGDVDEGTGYLKINVDGRDVRLEPIGTFDLNADNDYEWTPEKQREKDNTFDLPYYPYYFVVERKDLIEDWDNNKYQIWMYYTDDSNTAQNGTKDQPWKKAVDSTGTITIENAVKDYLQIDLKKKWMEWGTPTSWDTTTGVYKRLHDLVMGFVVYRRVWDTPDVNSYQYSNNDGHIISPGPMGWSDYGNEILVGYDSNGNRVLDPGGNTFELINGDGGNWHWTINNSQDHDSTDADRIGLPSSGWYTYTDANGEEQKVWAYYEYTVRETGIWKNLKKDPVDDEEISWFTNSVPMASWSKGGQRRVDEFNRDIGQDQDRLMNGEAYNMYVEKQWDGSEWDAREVYVKIYRQSLDGQYYDDFTKELARDIKNGSLTGYVKGNESMIDVNNEWIVLTPSRPGLYIDKVLKAFPNTSGTNPYVYWLVEVGYKDKRGNVHTFNTNGHTVGNVGQHGNNPVVNQSAVTDNDLLKLTPTYYAWQGGQYVTDYRPGQGKNNPNVGIIPEKGAGNKLAVKNTPVRDFAVVKKWENATGDDISNDPTVPNQLHIKIKQFRTARVNGDAVTKETYVKFGGSETLTITKANNANRLVVVAQTHPGNVDDAQTYSATVEDDTNVGAWGLYISGLEERYYDENGAEWLCTYQVEEQTNDIPDVFVTEVSYNGIIDRDNRNITITNVKMEGGMLKVVKQIADNSDYETEELFTLTVKLTPPAGESVINVANGHTVADYVEIDEEDTILIGDKQASVDATTGVVTITMTLAGRGSFTIKDITPGTKYVVSEDTSEAPSWRQVGDVDYSNSNKTIVKQQLDTATVTNEEPKIDIPVEKLWVDDENHSGETDWWPTDVTVHVALYKQVGSGTKTKAAEYTLDSDHKEYTFENMPLLDGGAITYTVEEVEVFKGEGTPEDFKPEEFASAITGDMTAGFTITNTKGSKGSVKVTKTFENITSDQIPGDFKIAASWDDGVKSVTLKINETGYSGDTLPDGVTVAKTGSGLEYTWTIGGLEKDTVVSFVESGYDVSGYSVTINGEATATALTATATMDPTAVTFTNTYTRDTGSLNIKKIGKVNGADPTTANQDLIDGEYTFNITGVGDANDSIKATVKITIEGGKVKSAQKVSSTPTDVTVSVTGSGANAVALIGNLPTGSYTVSETLTAEQTQAGISLLSSNGDTDVNVIANNSAAIPTATFTNNKPYVKAHPEVTKAVKATGYEDNVKWPDGVDFSFDLEFVSAKKSAEQDAEEITGFNMAKQTKQATKETEKAVFDDIAFTEPGVYTFKITEQQPANAPAYITYDMEPKTVTITVTEANGVLSAEVKYGENDTSLTVNNVYNATGTVSFKAKKTLEGGTLAADAYTFTLTEYTDDTFEHVKTVANGGVSQEKKNAAPTGSATYGDITFDNVTLTDTSTRYFIITESAPTTGADGTIIYDTHEQKVTVNVEDDNAGTLTWTKAYIPAYSEAGYDASFTNTKKGALKITKTIVLDGSSDYTTYTNGTFKFEITGTAGTATADISHKVEITFAGGQAASYKIDDGEEQPATEASGHSWSVVIPNLVPGQYTVSETDPGPMWLEKWTVPVNGGDNKTNPVTLTVVAGDDTASAETASATATNKREVEEQYDKIKLLKIDANSELGIADATFELLKPGDGEAYTFIKEYKDVPADGVIINTEDDEIKRILPTTNGGTVTLKLVETAAPLNYKKRDKTYDVVITRTETVDSTTKKVTIAYTITVTGGDLIEIEDVVLGASIKTLKVPNTPVGSIRVKKDVKDVHGQTSALLNGKTISFGLFNSVPTDNDVLDPTDDAARIKTLTIANGTAEQDLFTELELGTYYVYELELKDDGKYHPIMSGGSIVFDNNEFRVESADNSAALTVAGDNKIVTITNKLYEADITIKKTNNEATPTPLTGAEFKVKRLLPGETGDYQLFVNDAFAVDAENGNKKTGVLTVSSEDGVMIHNLLPGSYSVQETKAPAGYVITNSIFTFVINADGSVSYTDGSNGLVTYDSTNKTFTVKNEAGARLPSTGGMGTGLIYATGTGLLLLAVIAWVMKAKKRDYGAY